MKLIMFQQLQKKQCDQQEALWELVCTEASYIQLLSELTDIHHYMLNLQSEGYLKDIEVKNVFHNVADIYRTNLMFWTSAVEPMINR